MKNLLIASLLALAAVAPASGQDSAADAFAGETTALTGAEADAAVARASEWLDGIEGLRGRFQQLNPDGAVVEGDFFLQRPGKLRLDYDPPSPLVLISDGRVVWNIDEDLETADRAPLDETPLNVLVKPDIDLARDANVRGVGRQDGLVLISLGGEADQIGGQIVLLFADPEFALREWVAIDDSGQQTRVTLYDVRRDAALDPDLFVYDAETGSRRPGQR